MKVTLQEINLAFDELIEEKKTREQIAAWASIRQSASDADDLEFEPPKEKEKIWRAVIYLMGVDLIDFDGSYLHSLDNFKEFRKKAGL